MCERVKPAIPDFSWSPITSGEKDEEGYSIVKIQVSACSGCWMRNSCLDRVLSPATMQAVGHHIGKQFTLKGLNRSDILPASAFPAAFLATCTSVSQKNTKH